MQQPLPHRPTWMFPVLRSAWCKHVITSPSSALPPHLLLLIILSSKSPSALVLVLCLSADFCPSSSTSVAASCPPFLHSARSPPTTPPPPLPHTQTGHKLPPPLSQKLRFQPPIPSSSSAGLSERPAPVSDRRRKVEKGEMTGRKKQCHLTHCQENRRALWAFFPGMHKSFRPVSSKEGGVHFFVQPCSLVLRSDFLLSNTLKPLQDFDVFGS